MRRERSRVLTLKPGEHGRQSKAQNPEEQERADSPGPSCVPMKSVRSMHSFFLLKDGRPSREERQHQERSKITAAQSVQQHQTADQDACGLTLDLNTANRQLSLSEDNRKVTEVEEEQSYPDHPERFVYFKQVLCREGLTGHYYWEVEREGDVATGVTYRGIPRLEYGGDSAFGWNNKSWRLDCREDGYTAWYNGIRTEIRHPPLSLTE